MSSKKLLKGRNYLKEETLKGRNYLKEATLKGRYYTPINSQIRVQIVCFKDESQKTSLAIDYFEVILVINFLILTILLIKLHTTVLLARKTFAVHFTNLQ